MDQLFPPILFNIYMKSRGEVTWRFGVCRYEWVDDTQLCLSFSSFTGDVGQILGHYLASIMAWTRANNLKLNPDKTEILPLGGLLHQ